jgi:hypothetical protein
VSDVRKASLKATVKNSSFFRSGELLFFMGKPYDLSMEYGTLLLLSISMALVQHFISIPMASRSSSIINADAQDRASLALCVSRCMDWMVELHYRAGRPIQCERSRRIVRPVPRAVKAWSGVERRSRRDRAVVREIGNGHHVTTLRKRTVPELRNRLPTGERELETPAVDGCGSSVLDGQINAEAAGPLAIQAVMD